MTKLDVETERAPAADRVTTAVAARVQPLVEATRRGRLRRALHFAGEIAGAAILALFAFGTVMTATMLRWQYVAIAVVVLAAVPRLLGRRLHVRAVQVPVLTVLTIVVPVVALLGFDLLWAWARLPRPAPAVGLVIAGVVVAAVAYGYLRWVGDAPPPRHGLWSLYATLVALALTALTGQDLSEPKLFAVAVAAGVATWIYLGRAAGPRIKHPLWWALLLVGVAVVALPLLAEAIQGGRLSLTLLITGAIIAAFAGLNGLWLPAGTKRLRHARRAAGTGLVVLAVPLFVIAFLEITSTAPAAPDERPVTAAAPPAPLPAVAIRHRPIILFDSDERFRTPLDVDAMFATGDVQLCPEGTGLLADCRDLAGAGDLRNGFGNLRFDTQEIADRVEQGDIRTTIYAHVVEDGLHRGWTDVDYWWYLPDNPADTARGAMCGAGLVIPEITCFDHQSDWEGVTVVLDEDDKPVAVHYAAHGHVVEVPWTTLQKALRSGPLKAYANGRDVADRPLVFVARGTHAAYPVPCRSATCGGDTVFEDNRHDGAHEWPETPCSTHDCVIPFPQAAGGGDASWNAFDGYWGSAICVAKVYCARSNAPRSPAMQDSRYDRPGCFDFTTGDNLSRPRAVKRTPVACAAPAP